MKKIDVMILVTVSLAVVSSVASAQTSASQTTLVTVENYNRAQTDVNFAGVVKNGGFGKFRHGRELAPPAQQGIVRPNRDTLYSFAIVDLDAGPVTITLPDARKRFMGMQVVNQDQYTPATYYGAGTHTLTREVVGTRYAIVVVRFFVDFSNEEDVRQVHALQDEVRFSQERPGTFEVPHWDEKSLKKVHAALQQLGTTLSDMRRMFAASGKAWVIDVLGDSPILYALDHFAHNKKWNEEPLAWLGRVAEAIPEFNIQLRWIEHTMDQVFDLDSDHCQRACSMQAINISA